MPVVGSVCLPAVHVCANLPREVVGRALGGREPAKTLLLRSRRGGTTGVMLLSTALLGRFETRVCSLALLLVRRRGLQLAAVSVAAVVGRVSSCSEGKKGWRRA